LPGFTLSTNGRSIEVELPNTTPDESLVSPATDGRLIKMVSKVDNNTTTLSFYFRYPPQKVSTESNKDTGLLMLDILLGNQLSTSYPELSSKLQGVSVMKRPQSDSLNPVNTSTFAKNWLSFFTRLRIPAADFSASKLHLAALPPGGHSAPADGRGKLAAR
jgi:hypothetical protein